MAQKSILIIGAGVAGLSAGCYAQMNDYKTTIFEMAETPGGLCTSVRKGDYTIDYSLHWLFGSSPTEKFHQIWRELGAAQGREFVNQEEFMRIEDMDGEFFSFYCDRERLKSHMLALSPADHKPIRQFIRGIRQHERFQMPFEKPRELLKGMDLFKFMLSMAPLFPVFEKWGRISTMEFGNRFKHPLMRAGFPLVMFPDMPMLAILFALACANRKVVGYPIGGSLAFAGAIERRYKSLGGEVHYKQRVRKILVQNGKATGIELEDGTKLAADYVISAADGFSTLFSLLDGAYVNEEIMSHYKYLPIFPSMIHVALGVRRRFDEIPPSVLGMSIPLERPTMIGGILCDRLATHIYNFDPTLAPEGKTLITAFVPSASYSYWKAIRSDRTRYQEEKVKVLDDVISALSKRFPGLSAQIEMRSVATPVTWERYTGNWQGSFEGWLPTTSTWKVYMNKTLPGLSNFYLTGHWVEPGGGVSKVSMSGRQTIQLIAHNDQREFCTSIPTSVDRRVPVCQPVLLSS